MIDNKLYEKELINSIRELTKEVEKNNRLKLEENNKSYINEKHDIKYFIKRYIQEVIEASLGLFAVMIITKREFKPEDYIKIASIIGLITLVLEEYNAEYSNNFKQGIHFTMGAVAFGG